MLYFGKYVVTLLGVFDTILSQPEFFVLMYSRRASTVSVLNTIVTVCICLSI